MKILSIITVLFMSSSCATVFNMRTNEYQNTKPLPGEPARRVKVGWAIVDVLIFPPFLAVDLLTHSIYKRKPRKVKEEK